MTLLWRNCNGKRLENHVEISDYSRCLMWLKSSDYHQRLYEGKLTGLRLVRGNWVHCIASGQNNFRYIDKDNNGNMKTLPLLSAYEFVNCVDCMVYVFEESYDFLQYTVIHMQYCASINQITCHSNKSLQTAGLQPTHTESFHQSQEAYYWMPYILEPVIHGIYDILYLVYKPGLLEVRTS